MATFFGEVTGLSSRAVEEEFDEELPAPELAFEVVSDGHFPRCDFLVVAVGKLASAFVDSYFRSDHSRLAASAKFTLPSVGADSASGLDYRKRPKSAANVYIDDRGIVVCEVEDDVPEELNIELFQKLMVQFCEETTEALVLAANHSSKHKSDSQVPEPFLRCLLTPKYVERHSTSHIPSLKSPNIVADFAAAVLTHFQMRDLSAALVMCYTDVLDLDSKTVALFEPVLSMRPVQHNIQRNFDATVRLSAFIKANYKQTDNLFM